MRSTHESANLDFLRAYAVLAVYFGHILQTFHVERIVGGVTIYDVAQTGVLIFFVHTSLVLMLSMERLHTLGRRLFTVFYIRRAFRIYPLSIVMILAMLAAHAPSFPTYPYSRPDPLALFSNLTLTQNLTGSPSYPDVLWSLPFEVQMYVVLPMLFLFVRRFTAWWVPVALWIAGVLIIGLMFKLRMEVYSLFRYVPCFLGGIVGYRLWSARRMELNFWMWPVLITSCILVRSMAEAAGRLGTTVPSAWTVCLLLGFAVPQFRELGRGWIRSCAAIVSRYSYGIYLSHSFAFWIAFIVLRERPLLMQAIVCLVLSVLIPLALYHVIEKPMITVGIRIAGANAEQARAARVA